MKVDTQGSEVHVLRGATRVLASRHIAWQIEIDPFLLRRRAVDVEDLFALLRQHSTHYVDLNRRAKGARVRPIADLSHGLAYLQRDRGARTDVIAFALDAGSS